MQYINSFVTFIKERRNNPTSNASTSSEPGVQLLPRRDVQLYGTIPSIEERIYSRCTNCDSVYNPKEILNHINCVKPEPPAPPVVKKKVQSKNVNSKKTSSNGSISSHPTNSNIPAVPVASSSLQDPLKLFEFKVNLIFCSLFYCLHKTLQIIIPNHINVMSLI